MPKSMGGAAKLTKKMFVGGTGELTDEDLRDYFSQFGTIDDAAVSMPQQLPKLLSKQQLER
jgi:RNA recognition motif-containing protein